jgi:hypothetical protein
MLTSTLNIRIFVDEKADAVSCVRRQVQIEYPSESARFPRFLSQNATMLVVHSSIQIPPVNFGVNKDFVIPLKQCFSRMDFQLS